LKAPGDARKVRINPYIKDIFIQRNPEINGGKDVHLSKCSHLKRGGGDKDRGEGKIRSTGCAVRAKIATERMKKKKIKWEGKKSRSGGFEALC